MERRERDRLRISVQYSHYIMALLRVSERERECVREMMLSFCFRLLPIAALRPSPIVAALTISRRRRHSPSMRIVAVTRDGP